MTSDANLWIGIVAGAILGATATWISLAVAIALGRHLAHQQPIAGGHWDPDLDTELAHILETGR